MLRGRVTFLWLPREVEAQPFYDAAASLSPIFFSHQFISAARADDELT